MRFRFFFDFIKRYAMNIIIFLFEIMINHFTISVSFQRFSIFRSNKKDVWFWLSWIFVMKIDDQIRDVDNFRVIISFWFDVDIDVICSFDLILQTFFDFCRKIVFSTIYSRIKYFIHSIIFFIFVFDDWFEFVVNLIWHKIDVVQM